MRALLGLQWWLLAAGIAVALIGGAGLAACLASGPQVSLLGSGSTFVQPAMISWIRDFHSLHVNAEISYVGGGSGKGQQDLLGGKVDFACSDPPLRREAVEEFQGRILQFPVVLGAVVVTYNIPGLEDVQLNLTGRILAGIYLGEIRYWDDPSIAALNPGIAGRLPHEEIIAVHRSDASGTTEIFTVFLYKSSEGLWPRSLVGKVIEWPVDSTGRGLGEQGNPGVASAVENTPYSIGYLEWSYALERGMPIARIENAAGKLVYPTPESIEAAYTGRTPPPPTGDWSGYVYASIYSSNPDAYPVVGQTFMIVWRYHADKAKCEVLRDFILYIAGEGQSQLPRGYAPLPDDLRKVVVSAAYMLECPG